MANVQKPAGLVPVGHMLGLSWSAGVHTYYIPSTDPNAYAVGDPVGTATGAADSNGVSGVVIGVAGASAVLRGVIVGIGTQEMVIADPNNLNTMIIPATKTQAYYVSVVDDPWVIFAIQEKSGGSSTNFTAADIGKGCNLLAGTNNGYVSGWTLDDTAASSTSSTRQMRLLGISRRTNNAFGNYCEFLTLINQHELKAATAGV